MSCAFTNDDSIKMDMRDLSIAFFNDNKLLNFPECPVLAVAQHF